MPRLELLMTVRIEVRRPATDVGAGPSGVRQIHDLASGSFEGPKLRGRVLPSGADWLLVGADGVGRLDVRATLETDDGAYIYVQYPGVLVMNDAVRRAVAGGMEMRFGEAYMMTQPRFETGDARYAWLNSLVAVGQGRLLPGGVEYRVYAVEND
jgi:hypothetical protein